LLSNIILLDLISEFLLLYISLLRLTYECEFVLSLLLSDIILLHLLLFLIIWSLKILSEYEFTVIFLLSAVVLLHWLLNFFSSVI